jgi:hypothetical protein
MSVKVFLSNVGNPDFHQNSDRPLSGTKSGFWVAVEDVRKASDVCQRYIADNDLGGGNWPHAEVRDVDTDELLGHISYNGRFVEKEPVVPAPGM